MDIFNTISNVKIIKIIVDFFQRAQVHDIIFILKIVSAVSSAALLVTLIFCLVRSGYLKYLFFRDLFELISYRAYGQKKIVRRWDSIKSRLEKASESEYKLAIIEAETVFDEVLTRIGFTGVSVGEKLEKIQKEQLPSLDEVLEAHKTRNDIVHDPDYRLTLDQARKTIDIYEAAMKELEVF